MSGVAAAFAIANLSGAAALLKLGERPERAAVVVVVLFLAATPFVDHLAVGPFRWGVAALDLFLFAAFWLIAVRTRRWWLIDVAALQLLGVLTHLVPLISPNHFLWAQVSARYAIWALISLLFFIGAWEAWAMRPPVRPSAARPRDRT